MTDLPVLLDRQGLRSAPQQEGMEVDTNLIVPPLTMADRLKHFPDDIYDLSAESHLVRLAKVLLGEAGAGRLTKPNLLARLQQSIYGSHFYDLDRFYGALFGAQRRVAEIIDGDPMVDPHTDEEWEEIGTKDDSYRARMEQLVKAIALGATPVGMELVAEALLNVDCDVYESFIQADRTVHSYDDMEGIGTYASLNAFGTYADLESDGTLPGGHIDRYVFTVVPKRIITEEERYDLIRVLSVLKPAQSIVKVSALGVPVIEPVRIRSVSADSEYWRIIQRTTNGGGLSNKMRPAFAAYQGEAFTHLTAASGVSSYTLKDDGSIGQYNVFGVVRLDRTPPGKDLFEGHQGTTGYAPYNIVFTADLAVAPWETIIAGRLVSDGILTRNAYASAVRGAKNFLPVYTTQEYANLADEYSINLSKPQSLSGLYSDGYGLYTSGRWIFWGSFRTHQRFWATPERPYSDTTREVVELRLRTPRLVNYVSLELARFPHTAMVQAWSDEVGDWVTLRRWSVTENYPEVIPKRPNYTDTHPQHALSGHWQKFSSGTDAVRTDRLRVVLRRSDPFGLDRGAASRTPGPTDQSGKVLAYSLAVKNWDVGYRIKDRTDIPEPDETLGSGFATTIDAKGNTVVLDVAENRASNLLDSNAQTWRSEPQPTNRAVVNLYLDTRNADGTGQVVDKFYLDPAKSGPNLNLYWTESEEYGTFPASDAELEASTGGSVTPLLRGGLRFGATDPAWVEIDNDEIHFDPAAANWWAAMQFRPAQPTNTIEGVMGLFVLDDRLAVYMANDLIEGLTKIYVLGLDADNNLITQATAALDAATGETVTVSLSYVRDASRLYLTVKNGDIISQVEAPVNGTMPRPETIYIGGHPLGVGSNLTLDGFFLKVGVLRDTIEALEQQFPSYVLKAGPGVTTNDYTQNSIIRYYGSFSASSGNQPDPGRLGLRGGPADFFANAVWHPIEREYKLTKGYISLPPTRAKFWKMEFTNLVAEPIESFVPINRRVRLYPPDISGIGTPRPEKPIGDQWPGLRQAIVAAGSRSFVDRPVTTAKVWPSYRPTAVQHATDPRQAKTLRNASWLFGWQQWQVGSSAPRFHEVGQHVYDEFDIVDTSKVGYFVALKEVRAHRTDYAADDDTQIYREHFHDDSQMEDGYTWNLDPGHLYGDAGAVATSKPMVSRHPVRAIQFAATQSDAVQIVPDDDFRDERLSDATWQDDTTWHAHGDAVLRYSPTDYSVTISRNLVAQGAGAAAGLTFGKLPHEMVYPVFAMEPEEGAPEAITETDGGIESALAFTSPRGMLHAAARVTGITDTVNPLVLQIVGSDGTVLAEAERYVKQGETVEWSVPYQLGSFARSEAQAYERRSIVDTMVAPIIPDEAPVPTGDTPEPAPDELVRVRLVQAGASTDSWKVDRLSIFDDSLLWEFSVDGGSTWYEALDIRSNPNGVLAFPVPSTSLRWRVTAYRERRAVTSLQIRPWYQGQFATVLGQPQRGPNMSSFDHDPPIQKDPEFNVWFNPVPRWWWLGGRKFPVLPIPGQPLTGPNSRFYSRSAAEVLGEATDVGGITLSALRTGFNGQDGEGFNIYTEQVETPADEASRQVTYRRIATESVPPIEDEGHRSILHEDSILRPPVSPMNEDN